MCPNKGDIIESRSFVCLLSWCNLHLLEYVFVIPIKKMKSQECIVTDATGSRTSRPNLMVSVHLDLNLYPSYWAKEYKNDGCGIPRQVL